MSSHHCYQNFKTEDFNKEMQLRLLHHYFFYAYNFLILFPHKN